MNFIQILGVEANLIGEIPLIENAVQNDQQFQTPGVEVPIDGHKGRLALIWTPDAAATAQNAASTTEGSTTGSTTTEGSAGATS